MQAQEIKTIQIAKHPTLNKIEVYANHGRKIGEFGIKEFSEAFDWDGEKVIDFFLDVLTDCNYHSERKAIEKAIF